MIRKIASQGGKERSGGHIAELVTLQQSSRVESGRGDKTLLQRLGSSSELPWGEASKPKQTAAVGS